MNLTNPLQSRQQFETEVIRSNSPVVVVEFNGPWCVFCPQIEEILDELCDGLPFYGLDVDQSWCLELADIFLVKSIPTVMIFKNGDVKDVIVGVAPREVFRQKLDAVKKEGGMAATP